MGSWRVLPISNSSSISADKDRTRGGLAEFRDSCLQPKSSHPEKPTIKIHQA